MFIILCFILKKNWKIIKYNNYIEINYINNFILLKYIIKTIIGYIYIL